MLKDRARAAIAMMTLGLVEAGRTPGEPAGAARFFNRALRVFSRNKPRDRRHLAAALFEIGEQYRRWEDFSQAAAYLKRALNEASALAAARLVDRYRAEQRLVLTVKDYAVAALAARREREDLRLVLQYVAHDLGYEVMGVTLWLDHLAKKLERSAPGAVSASELDRLGATAAYLRMLCHDLTNTSRDGRLSVFPERTPLRPAIDRAFLILSPRIESGVERLNKVPEGTLVFADREHVLRILINLIGNAAKFTTRGCVAVSTNVAHDHDGFVRIEVADTGTGIAKQDLAKVFDLYAQSREYDDETRDNARQRHGYGIGLAYCREAVVRHGGEIWIDPAATCVKGEDPAHPRTHGTTICFTLPKAPSFSTGD